MYALISLLFTKSAVLFSAALSISCFCSLENVEIYLTSWFKLSGEMFPFLDFRPEKVENGALSPSNAPRNTPCNKANSGCAAIRSAVLILISRSSPVISPVNSLSEIIGPKAYLLSFLSALSASPSPRVSAPNGFVASSLTS